MLLHRSDSVIVVSPLALIMKVCVFVSIYSVKTLPACVYIVSFISCKKHYIYACMQYKLYSRTQSTKVF